MHLGPRAFVFTIYLALGLSFVAETGVLAWEYRDAQWFTLATQDSHLFLFFPLLGTVALAAFYVPSTVFVDMYWNHVRFGRARFLIGLVALALLSIIVAQGLLASKDRSIWEIAPAVLLADKSEPAGCAPPGRPCQRVALLEAVTNVRAISQSRLHLRDYVRECAADPFVERPKANEERRRFCFASTPMTTPPYLTRDDECCRAQERFIETINTLRADPARRSLTGKVHAALLPAKIFFLLILLAISVLLAARHASVAKYYPAYLPRIEIGVLVGAVAMVFFPLMSQAFVLTTDALYGTRQIGGFKPLVPLLSFGFGAWALVILLFFYRRRDRQVEMIGKMSGVLASAVAVFKYDLLISFVGKVLGAGASTWTVGVLLAGAIAAIVVLLLPLWQQFKAETSVPAPSDESPV